MRYREFVYKLERAIKLTRQTGYSHYIYTDLRFTVLFFDNQAGALIRKVN